MCEIDFYRPDDVSEFTDKRCECILCQSAHLMHSLQKKVQNHSLFSENTLNRYAPPNKFNTTL